GGQSRSEGGSGARESPEEGRTEARCSRQSTRKADEPLREAPRARKGEEGSREASPGEEGARPRTVEDRRGERGEEESLRAGPALSGTALEISGPPLPRSGGPARDPSRARPGGAQRAS